MPRPALEIEWNRYRSGTSNARRYVSPAFAKPLEEDVSTEGDAAEDERNRREFLEHALQRKVEIRGLAGVVKARRPIGLVAASPEDEHIRGPAPCPRRLEEATDVV